MTDKFWFQSPSIIYDTERVKEFIPTHDMSDIEKLNALLRLSIYLSVILFLYSSNYLYFYIIIITGVTTYIIYTSQEKEFNKEQYEVNNVTKPTDDNPFMNYNIFSGNTKNPPAIKSYNNSEVKKDINNKFNKNLYREVSDLHQKNNSQRQYYTMPCTNVVNDQTKFAKWLYQTDETCKEKGVKCASYW